MRPTSQFLRLHDALRSPRGIANLKELTDAISRMPASSSGLNDAKAAAEPASTQHSRMDRDDGSAGSRSTAERRNEMARKKAEILLLQERRAVAELGNRRGGIKE